MHVIKGTIQLRRNDVRLREILLMEDKMGHRWREDAACEHELQSDYSLRPKSKAIRLAELASWGMCGGGGIIPMCEDNCWGCCCCPGWRIE